MERTKQQQNELDTIERRILICLFGSENIPNSTAIGLRILNINPNDVIKKFENKMIPIMKKDGRIDGKILRKIIQFSKFSELTEFLNLPDEDFLLSDLICSIVSSFIPGVIA